MMAIVGFTCWDCTFRELFLYWQAKLLHDWDLRATQLVPALNLISLVNNILSREKIEHVTFTDVHPYRDKESVSTPSQSNLRITPKNHQVLRSLFCR